MSSQSLLSHSPKPGAREIMDTGMDEVWTGMQGNVGKRTVFLEKPTLIVASSEHDSIKLQRESTHYRMKSCRMKGEEYKS